MSGGFEYSQGANPGQMSSFFSAQFYNTLAPELRAALEGKAASVDEFVPVTAEGVLQAARTAQLQGGDIDVPKTIADVIAEAKHLNLGGGKVDVAVTKTNIQECLDENANLISAITQLQERNEFESAMQYQQKLQKNLLYLAALADLKEI